MSDSLYNTNLKPKHDHIKCWRLLTYREESKIEQTDRDFEKTDYILEHHMEVLSAWALVPRSRRDGEMAA